MVMRAAVFLWASAFYSPVCDLKFTILAPKRTCVHFSHLEETQMPTEKVRLFQGSKIRAHKSRALIRIHFKFLGIQSEVPYLFHQRQ